MFGVASTFRKTHGEFAFQTLARSAFADADDDNSGRIDMAELQQTLSKVGMKLTESQTVAIVEAYDVDGNHELDEDEFMKLVSDLIDGTAQSKLPLAARKEMEKVAARGVVKSVDDLFGSDDDEPKKKPPPKRPAAAPKSAAGASRPATGGSSAAKPPARAAASGSSSATPSATKPLPAAEAAKLQEANRALTRKNDELTARVKELEARLAAKG